MTYKIYEGLDHLHLLDTATTVAFDSETTGLKPTRGGLRLLQFGCKTSKTIVVIDCWDLIEKGWEQVKQFCDTPRHWIAHNAVFDVAWAAEHDLFFRGNLRCTMVASQILRNGRPNNPKHSLAALSKLFLNKPLDKTQQSSDWGAPVLETDQLVYAAKDVEVLLDIYDKLEASLKRNNLLDSYALECGAIEAIAEMQRCGMPWDKDALQQAVEDYGFDAETLKKDFILRLDAALPEEHKLPRDEDGSFNLRKEDSGRISDGTKQYAGFNLGSSPQMIRVMTHILGEPPVGANGKPSASREVLSNYAADHEVIRIYLSWKRAEKRRQMAATILEKHLTKEGRVHASYWQLGAQTSRMSCSEPNLQQVPRDDAFRACVVAPDGWRIVGCDFAGMELRLAAEIAQDPVMIKAFQQEQDLHQLTADAIGCDRQTAKSANFALLFGGGAAGLRNYCGTRGIDMPQKRAKEIRDAWLQNYTGIAAWQRASAQAADDTAKHKPFPEIRIPVSHHRRFLPGELNRLTTRCNTPVQGSGAAILKVALAKLFKLVREEGNGDVRICAAVHDEILLLCREEIAETWRDRLKAVMEAAESVWLKNVPPLAEARIGKSWAESH
jgi:DNA polymerase-1